MPDPIQTPPPNPEDKSVGELVFEVSERTSTLIREEIELAKAEIREKVEKLIRGGVVGIVAGTFALLALILIMHGIAWLLSDLVFGDRPWAGFFVEAALFLLIAAGAGLFAYRSLQAGAPPVPEQAIEEAKRTRAVLEGGGDTAGAATRASTRADTFAADPKDDTK
jgi:uncharacterized membrane protein YqjE